MEESSDGKKSSPEEHQETQFDHVPRADSIRSKIHPIQCICHMRVAIVTAYVVHPPPIFLIGKVNRLIPLLPLSGIIATRNKGRCVQTKGPCRFAKRHPPPITNAIRSLKVGSDALGVSDPHVTNKRQNVRYRRKG